MAGEKDYGIREVDKFVLQLKGPSESSLPMPKQTAALVDMAVKHPEIFVFGELLQQKSVQQLQSDDDPKHVSMYELLKLFAFGTYADYKENDSKFPSLKNEPAAVRKLKMLTIAEMAARKKLLPYAELVAAVDMGSVRELEDLIIECFYAGLIRGNLDQRKQQLDISFSFGRDVRIEEGGEIDRMIAQLDDWSKCSQSLIKAMEAQSGKTRQFHEKVADRQQQLVKQVGDMKEQIKKKIELEGKRDISGVGGGRGGRRRNRGMGGMMGSLLRRG